MDLPLFLQLILKIITFVGMIILNFVIFKIPVKENDMQIVLFSCILGITNFYFKVIVQTDYFIVMQVSTAALLFLLLRRYPLFYALIVSITGALVNMVIDVIVSFSVLSLGIFTLEQMKQSLEAYMAINAAFFAINIMAAYLLRRYNIGFSFIIRRFSGRHKVKGGNYIWAAGLILSVSIIQILFFMGSNDRTNQIIIFAVVLVSIMVSLYYAYLRNDRVLRDPFGNYYDYKREEL